MDHQPFEYHGSMQYHSEMHILSHEFSANEKIYWKDRVIKDTR